MVLIALFLYSALITGGVSLKVLRLTSRYRYDAHNAPPLKGTELPSVSVCIAARNETHALAENLECVLASDYEKLEILVLDDNSNDDTSVIIKSFAHAGVRFIPGRSLPPGWLGRNHAYYTLSHEASGDIILFLDVDTKLAPQAISQLIGYMRSHKLAMQSVQPRREDALRLSAVFGSLRPVWELWVASKQTPPAASGLWMIERSTLYEFDSSIAEYGMSVRPELHLAHTLQASKRYRYLIATKALGVRYEKKWHSQAESAERLYLPLFGRTFFSVAKAALLFTGLLLPYGLLVYGLVLQQWEVAGLAFAISLVAGAMNARMVSITHATEGAVVRAIVWPLLLFQDVFFYVRSWFRYQTKTVTWKGRNIMSQPQNRTHLEIDQ